MGNVANRLTELRRKLTLEDFLLIIAIMYTWTTWCRCC